MRFILDDSSTIAELLCFVLILLLPKAASSLAGWIQVSKLQVSTINHQSDEKLIDELLALELGSSAQCSFYHVASPLRRHSTVARGRLGLTKLVRIGIPSPIASAILFMLTIRWGPVRPVFVSIVPP